MIKKWQIAVITAITFGALLMGGCSSAQVVKSGDTVKVDYTGKLTDGTVFDSSVGKTPLEFTVGTGAVIEGFDAAVLGMKVGETKTVTIPPDKAYGERSADMIVTVNRSQLPQDIVPVVGGQLQVMAQGSSGGQTVVITEVTDTTITVDANPPLAGKTLVFEIKMVEIEKK